MSRYLNNKYIKRIKKYIVKKVTLMNYFFEEEALIYKLQLNNFWGFKKNIEVKYSSKNVTDKLSFEVKGNILLIKVPKQMIQETEGKAVIHLRINNKLMWIKEDVDFTNNNESIIFGDQYYVTHANKNIALINKFTEFDFSETSLMCTNLSSSYNTLLFRLDDENKIEEVKPLEIYAFNNHKVRILEGIYNSKLNTVKINDLLILSNGLWKLFIKLNNTLHPLGLEERELVLDTYNHKVNVTARNKFFYLYLQPHLLSTDLITINKEMDQLTININSMDIKGTYELLLEDVNNNEERLYLLQNNDQGISTQIPLKDLYENISTKRFFLIQKGEKLIKHQFKLKKGKVVGTGVSFKEIVQSQFIRFSFYVRKDTSLGVKVLKPRLRKMITGVENFKVSGFVGSLDAFVNCDAFLTIEERNSLETIKIPLEAASNFEVDLDNLNLSTLKSKDKTVMDFFIEVINQENEIIRKEKIKYKFSNYKKDNYYEYKVMEDNDLNQHHFLFTTTPFNNLKLETFSIPNNIIIPEDTSEKDNNIWLMGERYNTAQDNGIVFFNWLQKNTNIEAYYVMEADSPDYEQIKGNPNVLTFGSQKHFDIAVKAKVLLGTHDLENILPYKPAKGFFHYENTYKVFLQHGVLGRKNVEYHKNFYEIPFDLFIVSSDPEKYDIVMDQMGYENNEVAVTGLARFDNLIQKVKPKDILLMPTWRDWINTDQQFLESEYYATYLNLINNEKLLQILEKYDVNLNFYPHYRAQDYFENNISVSNNRINFIPLGSKHVQQLLIEHAMLITDYSSVSFDFLKMKKPIIHYHFDVERFFRRGILRPVEETFIGGIAFTEEEIVELIEDRLKHHFENYDLDISDVIKYEDRSNCMRIYKTIIDQLYN